MRLNLLLVVMQLPLLLRAQLVNYSDQGRVRILSSALTLTIDTVETRIRPAEESSVLLSPILPPMIDMGVALLDEALKHGAQKYSGVHTASASVSNFWINNREVSLPVLRISRWVIRTGSSSPEEAFQLTLHPELSGDGTAFRFVLKEPVNYRYASVKTKKKYDYINLDLLITLRALTVEKGVYKLLTLRQVNYAIPMIKAGGLYEPSFLNKASAWFPFPPMPAFEVEGEKADEVSRTVGTRGTNNGKPDNDTLTTVTRTVTSRALLNRKLDRNSGTYEFTVELMETNPYKAKAVVEEKVIRAGLDPMGDMIRAALPDK